MKYIETCSICLDLIKEDHVQKILTCGHSLHFRCFVRMVYRNINVFIACPVCRVVNKDVTKPFSDPEKNYVGPIKELFVREKDNY